MSLMRWNSETTSLDDFHSPSTHTDVHHSSPADDAAAAVAHDSKSTTQHTHTSTSSALTAVFQYGYQILTH